MDKLANGLIAWARRTLGAEVVVTSVHRSSRKQAKLYADWKAGKSKYPAAPPGTSTHERRLAFDVGVPGKSKAILEAMGKAWERVGLTWGGRFGDPIHFDFRRR